MKRFPIISLALTVFCAACDSPTDAATKVHGYDLEVVLQQPAAVLGVDANSALPIVSPDLIHVPYTIRNRGDEPAPAHLVEVFVGMRPRPMYPADQFITRIDTIEIRALQPGETLTGVADVKSERLYLVARDSGNDRVSARANLVLPDTKDIAPANNDTVSPPFHVAVAIVSLELQQTVPPKVAAGEPFPVTITLHNYARHASASGISSRFCFIQFDYGCNPQTYTFFGEYDYPTLPPGGTFTATYNASVPLDATDGLLMSDYGIMACVVPASWRDPYRLSSDPLFRNMQGQECPTYRAGRFVVRPDFALCQPPLLEIGVTAALPKKNCGLYPATTQDGFDYLNIQIAAAGVFMFSFNGVAGHTYTIPEGYSTITDRYADRIGYDQLGAFQIRATRTQTFYVNAGLRTAITVREP